MVSVIIPVYNSEMYLGECIESIRNQTYDDIEILLVDDGSTDKSLSILRKAELLDNRIKVLCKSNGGASSARNLGLKHAQGEYITFVDSDDFLEIDSIECLLKKMIEFDCDRVCGGSSYYSDSGNIKKRCFRMEDGLYQNAELNDYSIDDGSLSGFLFGGVANCMFKHRIIEDNNILFDERIRFNEDGLFHFSYALCSNSTYIYKKHTKYMYRQHSNSVSHRIIKREDFVLLHNRLLQMCDSQDYSINIQIDRRYVTESFWIINSIVNNFSFSISCKNTGTILRDKELLSRYKFCNLKIMPKSKRVVIALMRSRNTYLLVVLLKYIVPLLR